MEKNKGFLAEFKAFIMRGNVLDMAIGVIIATAFGKITTSLVNDVLMPLIRKKVEKLRLFSIGVLIQVIGFAVLLALTFSGLYRGAWFLLLLPGIMVYAGYGVLNVLLTVFLSDSVDYGEAKNGSREESVIFSMQTFTVKLASGLAAFLSGLAIDMVGLNTEALSQSAATLSGLRIWMTVPSAVILLVAFIVFKKCYKLNDKKMQEIKEKLTLKKEGSKR